MSTTLKTTVLRTVHTGLTVTSLDDAISFWCGVLGFELTARKTLGAGPSIEQVVGVIGADIEIAVVTAPGGHQIELLEYKGPDNREVFQPRSCDVGSTHLTFEVSELGETLRRVEEVGWKRLGTPQIMPSGMLIAYVRGPEGHTIEFVNFPDQ